jgi:DNA invertase Pin-like site-specific DNA recombinase
LKAASVPTGLRWKKARLHRASLVVSKVDRLTRSVAFLSRLLEAGVDVRFADLPQIEGATGRFLLQQTVAVAELEAGMISARTKAALAAAKKRGKKLGGNRGVKPTAKMRALSTAVLQQRADARAADSARRSKACRQPGKRACGQLQTVSTSRRSRRRAAGCLVRGPGGACVGAAIGCSCAIF